MIGLEFRDKELEDTQRRLGSLTRKDVAIPLGQWEFTEAGF